MADDLPSEGKYVFSYIRLCAANQKEGLWNCFEPIVINVQTEIVRQEIIAYLCKYNCLIIDDQPSPVAVGVGIIHLS